MKVEKYVYSIPSYPRCPDGEIWVTGYTDMYGRMVRPHCRKSKKRKGYGK